MSHVVSIKHVQYSNRTSAVVQQAHVCCGEFTAVQDLKLQNTLTTLQLSALGGGPFKHLKVSQTEEKCSEYLVPYQVRLFSGRASVTLSLL